MEPEITTPATSGNKKKILLISLVLVLVVVGVAVWYLFIQKDITPQVAEVAPLAQVKKDYTYEEKMKILADIAAAIPKETVASQAEKMRILNNLAKKVPVSTASTTAERMQILEALAVKAGQ